MTSVGWIQVLVFFALIVAVAKPLGAYMFRVFEGGEAPLGRGLGRLENGIYRLFGVDPRKEQDWKQYAFSLLCVYSADAFAAADDVDDLSQVLAAHSAVTRARSRH